MQLQLVPVGIGGAPLKARAMAKGCRGRPVRPRPEVSRRTREPPEKAAMPRPSSDSSDMDEAPARKMIKINDVASSLVLREEAAKAKAARTTEAVVAANAAFAQAMIAEGMTIEDHEESLACECAEFT